MSVRSSDKIIAPSRGTAGQAKAYARDHHASRPEFTDQYIDTAYDLCAPDNMPDAAIVTGQWAHETADPQPGQSFWYETRGNPAGIGITGDPDQNNASKTFQTGAEAARAHVAHLVLYATGEINRGGLKPSDDPRYDAYREAYGSQAMATTIDGLTGKWGVDPNYAAGVVKWSNILQSNLPDQSDQPSDPGGEQPVADLVFGKVPHPAYTDRIIPSSQNSAWNNLGKRTVRAVVWHRMLGTLWGTDGWFRGGGGDSALTDYGVGVLAQDGADNDGVILRWNDPEGTRSPWANGRVSAPYGDGLAFVNRYGVDAVNRDATAIEISGHQNTALSEKSRDAICGITAYWADQAKIPYNTFPAVPGEGRSFVIWHQEFTIGTGKECPFAVVMNETNALIEQTRGILKKYQTESTKPTPKPPTYADPIIPDWLTEDLKDGKPNDHKWVVEIDGKETTVEVFAAHRPFTMVKGANRLQLPFTGAKKVGPRLEVRETFMGRNAARVGTKVFVQTEWGTWIDNAAMTPRISIRRA